MPAPTLTDVIDRVDDRNRPVGVIRRGDVLKQGANFRTVHVLLFDGQGRVLLQRLASGRRRFPGRLGSSVAGYLHHGESFEAAARRRTFEELGLHPALDSVGVTEMVDERSKKFVGVFSGDGRGATLQDPDHIGELLWVRASEVDATLAAEGDRFTPTFAMVWRYARASDR